MNLPQNYYLIGVSLLYGLVAFQFLSQVCNIFLGLVIGIGENDFNMNKIYFATILSTQIIEGIFTIFSAIIINTKRKEKSA